MSTNKRVPFVPDEPKLLWKTELGSDRLMQLLDDFLYTDPEKKPWLVPAKPEFWVDGASIPAFLWSTVGSPYTGDYRRASIVHDFFCIKASSKERLLADRMFRSACIDGGCSPKQAWLLYIGVRIGAHLNLKDVAVRSTYPTLDFKSPGQPRHKDLPYLKLFSNVAALAENKSYPKDDDALANSIDKAVEFGMNNLVV